MRQEILIIFHASQITKHFFLGSFQGQQIQENELVFYNMDHECLAVEIFFR